MSGVSPKQIQKNLDSDDLKIEKGDLDPQGDFFYPKGVLNILDMIFRAKKFQRPRGTQSPQFSFDEVRALADLLFFKSPYVVLNVYKRLPRKQELPLRRKMFVHHLIDDAKGNAAKAARLAGYSPRSAKQIAYKLLRS